MEIKAKSVVKNGAWLIAESLVTMGISLIVGIISARYLGPSNYGLINRFAPYISLANSICTFGMQSIIIRDISRDNSSDNISRIMGSTMVFRIILSIVGMICIDLYAFEIAKRETPELFVIACIQSLVLVFNCYEIISFYFHAVLKAKFIAIGTVATSIIIGLWKICLLAAKADVIWFACSTAIQSCLLLCFSLFFFKKGFRYRLSVSTKTLTPIIKDSYQLLLASMGIAVYGQVDKIMIGSMLGNTELGYYTAAYSIATLWYFLPQAMCNSIRSKIFASSSNETAYEKCSRVLFLMVSILGIIAGLGFSIIPGFCIRFLYGDEYMAGKASLIILGWVGLFANIGTGRSIWLVGKGLQRYAKYFTLMGALLNIILNWLLIPWIGIAGAAVATVVSQGCVQIVFPCLFRDTRPVVKTMLLSYREWRYLRELIAGYAQALIHRRKTHET